MSYGRGIKQNESDTRLFHAYKASKRTDLVAPATWVNSAMKGIYTGNNMSSPRAGANERAHASLPMGAQIQRSV